jgi:hypothetical protein
MPNTSSRQVAYLPVYELLSPLLGDPGLIPGSPVWCQLDNTDPAKWQAVLWSAVWWSLAQDAHQEAMAEAGSAISASPDISWPQVSREIHQRSTFRAERPWMKREAS